MDVKDKVVVFWFRRDLRLHDNVGLFHALSSGFKVLPIFIFDTDILKSLSKSDPRVSFIAEALEHINKILFGKNKSIKILYGKPLFQFQLLLKEFDIQTVYTNTDYEPYATKRDTEIAKFLKSQEVDFKSYKDQVVYEKDEIVKIDGSPYTVFTPYSKTWKLNIKSPIATYASDLKTDSFLEAKFLSPLDLLKSEGFELKQVYDSPPNLHKIRLFDYEKTRDFPSLDSTSRLSVHLRFGTVSIRETMNVAMLQNQMWLNELIWREFFMQILYHFPNVESGAFKPKYNFIPWRNDENDFERWCKGNTGYPLVDAGMRELNTTGFMHNRVRMITASFLTKHLLLNWKWGEAYFAEKLMDFDLSANNGNWQWAAGTGCDAAPYFRIFNPVTQAQKFDNANKYIEHWLPELHTKAYPKPIVEHVYARERCLSAYKSVL